MPTFPSATRTVSVAAPPSVVLDLLADSSRLPDWAPDFAASGIPFTLRSSADQGTVDIVVCEDPAGGVFARVLPNGDGSEVSFTVIFPVDVEADVVAGQAQTLETELEAIRSLCTVAACRPMASPTASATGI